MLLYFTSTGNCKYAAESFAEALGDRAVSIAETKNVSLAKGEKLGFVFPTYFWRLPSVVDEYMNALTITAEDDRPYIFFVATYGGTCGQTGTYMKRHIKKKGYSLSAAFGIKTVDDYTIFYGVNDKEKINAVLAEEKKQIAGIIEQIKDGATGNRMKNKLPMIAVMGSNVFYKRARRTKHFHVEDSCVGCGLCEKECPVGAIKLKDGKPSWVKDRCSLCLHCLHYCPKFAVQYDDKTQGKGQYRHP